MYLESNDVGVIVGYVVSIAVNWEVQQVGSKPYPIDVTSETNPGTGMKRDQAYHSDPESPADRLDWKDPSC